jgi:predicted NACHT family NTPase/transcriptional regulator with XRE-family HTH domain
VTSRAIRYNDWRIGANYMQATPEGLEAARIAMIEKQLIQKTLASRVSVERQTIGRFLSGKSVGNEVFVKICQTLNLDWRFVAKTNSSTTAPQASVEESLEADVDELVQQTREAIRRRLCSQCGTMRVLDMQKPIELTGESGIYTNVNILERLTRSTPGQELAKADGISRNQRFRDLGRTVKRLPGLDVVKNYSRLIVLGKPGAGKTTFLKYLAMQCITGKFAANKVPFFVTLKDFADTSTRSRPKLVKYLANTLSDSMQQHTFRNKFSELTSTEIIKLLLNHGRCLILLDGLDEVLKEDTKRIYREIGDAADKFYQSQFVITCRIAAQEFVFDRFVEVEVADFDGQQIATFVENWFRAKNDSNDSLKATKFIQKIQQNLPIRELASNPLLLTLFCLVFGESGDFPSRRADLYEEGVKILLKKWDATRNIQRDELYRELDVQRREDLLSFVAYETFSRGELILEKRKIEGYVASFLQNLRYDDSDHEIRVDSEAVLRAIEAQHGLLIQRARGVYTFSHLTLQEYFTAREITLTNQPTRQREMFEVLKDFFSNPRWREVFLLTMEMSRDASNFLLEIKRDIDLQVANEKLQNFLQWVQEKSSLTSTRYKLPAVRAFYYNLVLSFDDGLARKLDPEFNYNECPDLKLDYLLNVVLNRAMAGAAVRLDLDLMNACQLIAETEEKNLRNTLQNLYDQLPDNHSTREELRQWYKKNGPLWVSDLYNSMVVYRNHYPALDFTLSQRKLLRQHHDSNSFLLECLNTKCYVDRDVRKYIEETLLLNIEESEREKERRRLMF